MWSDNFIANISDAYRNRKVSIPNKPSFLRKKPISEGQSSVRNPQTKLDEIKEEKMIIEERSSVVVNPLKFYSENIGPMLPMVADLIEQYEKDLPPDLMTEAMKIAVANNKRSTKHVEVIWQNWIKSGIKTMDDYKRHEAERAEKGQKGPKKQLDFNRFEQRNYTDQDLEHLFVDFEKGAASE